MSNWREFWRRNPAYAGCYKESGFQTIHLVLPGNTGNISGFTQIPSDHDFVVAYMIGVLDQYPLPNILLNFINGSNNEPLTSEPLSSTLILADSNTAGTSNELPFPVTVGAGKRLNVFAENVSAIACTLTITAYGVRHFPNGRPKNPTRSEG